MYHLEKIDMNNVLKLEPKVTKSKSKDLNLSEHLAELNKHSRVKLRIRQKGEKYFFFLELNHAGNREREYLGLSYEGKRNTRRADKDALIIARHKQQQANDEFIQREHNFKLRHANKKITLIDYFIQNRDTFEGEPRKYADKKNWQNTLNHLQKYIGNRTVLLQKVDRDLCEGFAIYLKSKLNPNTAHIYFSKLKAVLNLAIKDELILTNPAQFVKIKKRQSQRGFLTIDEIQKLIDTPFPGGREQLKRAFLFGCFTGLRISDITKLTWDNIHNGYIEIRQTKTGDLLRLKLNETALTIIELQKHEAGDNVFKLMHPATALQHLKKWAKDAGITKPFFWHIARHTFATMALSHGAPIYTVSKILGHQTVKVTEIYSKVIDQEKDKAIDNLPKLEIGGIDAEGK